MFVPFILQGHAFCKFMPVPNPLTLLHPGAFPALKNQTPWCLKTWQGSHDLSSFTVAFPSRIYFAIFAQI